MFQKNHDFKLNLRLKLDEKFLILYRNDKILQLESWFRLTLYTREIVTNTNYKDKNIFNKLIEFIKKKSKYYDDFVEKYIKLNNYKQALIITYDDFLLNYKNYIKQIILYLNLTNSENIDLDIEKIVNTFEKIEYKHTLDDDIYKAIKKILKL